MIIFTKLKSIRFFTLLYIAIALNAVSFLAIFFINYSTQNQMQKVQSQANALSDIYSDILNIEEKSQNLANFKSFLNNSYEISKEIETTKKNYNEINKYLEDISKDVYEQHNPHDSEIQTNLNKIKITADAMLKIKIDFLNKKIEHSQIQTHQNLLQSNLIEIHNYVSQVLTQWSSDIQTNSSNNYSAVSKYTANGMVLIIVSIVTSALLLITSYLMTFKSKKDQKMIKFYREAIDKSSMVCVSDVEGTILHVNDSFCKASGYERDELVGKSYKMLNSGQMNKAFFRDLWTTIKSGQIWSGEICNKSKDGQLYWVDTTIVPNMDDAGKPINFISIRRDITAKKNQEVELLSAKRFAENAAQTKAKFLAVMSHEIRTPLNGILGMTTLMDDLTANPEARQYLQLMKQSGNNLLALLNDILDFSKLEAGKITLEKTKFNLNSIIHEATSLLYLKAKEKSLKVEVKIDYDVPENVLGDPTRIRQILMNLVSNAIKFTSQGQITVHCKVADNLSESPLIQIDVTDSGIGMSAEDQAKLFSAFSQVDASTTRKFGGTGLGLAICKGLSEAMGGAIWVNSQIGQGSTFSFTFEAPLAIGDTNHIDNIGEGYFSDLATHLPAKILVADDNTTNQLIAKKFLEKLGYSIDTASNGKEVLKHLEQDFYDIIFMDIHMPEMDGFEATAAIYAKYTNTKIPWIAAFTASLNKEEEAQYFAAGMKDVVCKPFTAKRLQDAIVKAMNFDVSHLSSSKRVHPTLSAQIVNRRSLIKRFEDDEDILSEVIKSYSRQSGAMIYNLQKAIDEKNTQQIEFYAHTLKGVVSNFHVQEIQTILKTIEATAKSGRLDGLEDLWNSVLPQLKKMEIELSQMVITKEAA